MHEWPDLNRKCWANTGFTKSLTPFSSENQSLAWGFACLI